MKRSLGPLTLVLAIFGALAFPGMLLVSGCGKKRAAAADTREFSLTEGARVRTFPLFSPDGRWLAYTDQTDEPTVYVMPAGGGVGKPLLPADSIGIAIGWSPDSQSLLVLVMVDSRTRIRAYSLSGDIEREIPALSKGIFSDVSSDGHRFLWRKLSGDTWDMGISGEADSTWHTLGETPEWEMDASFGPGTNDVTLVRLTTYNAPTSELGIYSMKTRAWSPLPLPKASNREPVWDPGRTLLAFISDRKGSGDLWIYDWKNTRLMQITSGPEDDQDPAWASDGASVVVSRKVTSSHVMAANPSTFEKVQITDGDAKDYYPRCSPDGRWVAFFRKEPSASMGAVGTHLCVMPTAVLPTAAKSPVTTLDLGDLVPTVANWMFAWSPDGANLVFTADDGTGNVDLYRIPREGGHPDRITVAPGLDAIPDWSPDGQQISYTRLAEGETQIWSIPATGGIPVQITHHQGASEVSIWAPDSDHLAYFCSQRDMNELRVTSLKHPEDNRVLLSTLEDIIPLAWSAQGDQVLFFRDGLKTWSFEAVPVIGGTPFKIGQGESTGPNRFFGKFDPKYERMRERVYPGNLNVFTDGDEIANLVRVDISRLLAQGFQAAGE
jgi:Tol biopolymer transport system component